MLNGVKQMDEKKRKKKEGGRWEKESHWFF